MAPLNNQGGDKEDQSHGSSNSFACSWNGLNELISYEKQLRLVIDNKILQTRFGKFVHVTTAMLVGISSLAYVALTYMPHYNYHMAEWYNSADKSICSVIMVLYLIKVYVSQHRQNEIFSIESLLNIIVFAPVMIIPID